MAKKPPARKAAKKRVVRPPFGTQTKTRTMGAADRPPFGTQLETAADRPPFGTQLDTIGAAQYPGAPMPNPPWTDPTRPPRPPFGTSVATQGRQATPDKATRSRPRDKGI
jgi:hypothetical protein